MLLQPENVLPSNKQGQKKQKYIVKGHKHVNVLGLFYF